VPEKDAWEGARSLAAEVVDFDPEQAGCGTRYPKHKRSAFAGRQGVFSPRNGS